MDAFIGNYSKIKFSCLPSNELSFFKQGSFIYFKEEYYLLENENGFRNNNSSYHLQIYFLKYAKFCPEFLNLMGRIAFLEIV